VLVAAIWVVFSHRGDKESLSVAMLQRIEGLAPPERREWLAAMLAEISAMDDGRSARRFARGCLRAALCSPPARDRTTSSLAGLVTATVGATIALCVYGLLVYPEIRSDWPWLIYLVVFVGLVAVYGLVGLQLAQLGSSRVRLLGVGVGLSGALVGWWAASSQPVVSSPIALLAVAPPLLATGYVIRRTKQPGQAVVWAGEAAVMAGLSSFIGYVTTVYTTGGGPRTAASLQQFAMSGAHNYTSWAVSDELSGAVFLLAAVPILTVVAAAVATQVGRNPSGPELPLT
jgi:hypothetical protein